MEPNEIWQQAVAGTVGGGALVMLIFKVLSFIRKEQEGQNSSIATSAQFKMLQEQITQNHADTVDLRAVVNVMDKTIHKQQRTITRLEMLLRQFSGLVREKEIEIPNYMQEELDQLITAGEDRMAAEMKRRETDI
jgi:hypothetical protein